MNRKVFIGRESELEQFRRIMDALVESENRSEPYTNTILVYGVGGMGKTCLCKRFLEIARTEYPEVVRIDLDWGARVGCAFTPVELLDSLRGELQKEFAKEMQPYSSAKKDIGKTQVEIDRLLERDKELIDTAKPIVSSVATAVTGYPPVGALVSEGLGLFGKVLGAREEDRLRNRWGVNDEKLLLYKSPELALVSRLRECMNTITTKENQILMVLDTCEVIRRSEAWLMDHLLVPLLDSNRNVVLVYSGRDNTYTLHPVTIDGQTTRVYGFADRLSHVPPIAIDMKLFSEVDIRNYLKAKLEQDVPEAVVRCVQTLARGVPYAVDLLTNAMQNVGIEDAMEHFGDVQFQKQLQLSASNEQVIRTVAERFLFYCFQTEQNRADLPKLYALAILPDTDPRIFRELWQVQDPADDLQMLQGKYAFLVGDGKLHEVVQEFLVEYLMGNQALREGIAKDIAERALPIYQKVYENECEKEPIWRDRFNEGRWREAATNLLNCLVWSDPSQASNFFVNLGVEQLLFDTSFILTCKKPLDKALERELVRQKQRRQVNSLMEAEHSFRWWSFSEKVLSFSERALKEWELQPVHRSILALLMARMQYYQNDHEAALNTLLHCDETPLEQSVKDKLAEALDAVGQIFCLDKGNHFFFSEEALRAFEKVVQLDDRKDSYLYHLAVMLRQSGQAEKALPYYSRALQLDPKDKHLWTSQGLALNELGRHEDAITSFEKALAVDPKHVHAHVGLADIYHRIGRHEDAITSLKKALAVDPKHVYAHVRLAGIYHSIGRYASAVAAYHKAMEIDSSYIYSYTELADLYCDLGEFGKAEEVCAKAAAVDSENAVLLNTMGTVQAWQGEFAKAMEYFHAVIKMEPSTLGFPYNNIAEVYCDMGQYEEAIEYYTKAVEHGSKYAHTGLGYVYLVLGELDKAESALLQAIQIQRNSSQPKMNLALVYLNQGNLEQARQCFAEAEEICDRNQTIGSQLNKVVALSGLEKFDEALLLLKYLADNFTIGPQFKECLRDLQLLASAPGSPEGIQGFLERVRVQWGITEPWAGQEGA